MRIRFSVRPVQSPDEVSGPLLFQPIGPRRTRLGPIFGSLALHAAAIVVVTWLSQAWMASAPRKTEPSRYRYELFVFRSPEPALYQPEPVKAPRQPLRKAMSRKSQVRPEPPGGEPQPLLAPPAPEPAPAPKVRRAFAPPAQIELPRTEHSLPNAPVILQAENRSVALPKEISTAAVASWSRRYAPRREFVAPGRTQPKASQPRLDAPPKLAVSNRATATGALNVTLAQTGNMQPALPLPDSTTAPVRTGGSAAEPDGELGTSTGDPAQLIVISPVTAAPGSMVEAPRDVRNVPPSGDPASPGGNGPGGSGSGQGSASAAGSQHGSGSGSGSGSGRGSGPGAGSDSGSGGSASGSGSGSSRAERGRPGLGTAAVTPEPRVRIVNPPNGSFDVVVTQSAVPPALQGLGVSLTGSPVFTVYLKVGDDREWLLQYCVPVANKPAVNPYEVFVGAPTPIVPPYPLSTVIPKSILGRQSTESVAFHGRLNASGVLSNLELSPQKSALGLQILPMLGDWRFRPAAVDGRPSEVEVLLVVPGRLN